MSVAFTWVVETPGWRCDCLFISHRWQCIKHCWML